MELSYVRGIRIPRSRKTIAATGLAALVLVAGTAVGINASTHSGSACVPHPKIGQIGRAGGAFSGVTLGANPFACGKSVTLAQLAADYPGLRLPKALLANASNVSGAWEDSSGDGGSAAIYYSGSRIEVLYGPIGSTGRGGFQAPGHVQTIGGIRALAFPAGYNSRFTQVSLPLPSDRMVILLSLGPLRDLRAVAAQMVPKASSGG